MALTLNRKEEHATFLIQASVSYAHVGSESTRTLRVST